MTVSELISRLQILDGHMQVKVEVIGQDGDITYSEPDLRFHKGSDSTGR